MVSIFNIFIKYHTSQYQSFWYNFVCSVEQWHSHWGGKGGRVATPDSENLPNIWKKRETFRKNREKSEKNREKRGKIGKKRRKIGKFLSLCPSWQIGPATLLAWKRDFSFRGCSLVVMDVVYLTTRTGKYHWSIVTDLQYLPGVLQKGNKQVS